MALTTEEINTIADEVANRVLNREAERYKTISCKEALDLATLIDQTAQIEDLLGVEGQEEDLTSIASRLPLPTSLPRFAERVDEWKSGLSKVSKQTSDETLSALLKNTLEIRDEASKYIGAALTRCVLT